MKTIETLSVFPIEVEKVLIANNIVNWIWWQWWFNFNKFFRDNIVILNEYIPEKWNQLIHDITRISHLHDLLFLAWWSKLQFYFANYIFCRDLYKLLNFIWFFKRLSIIITIFILLNKYWKKYFNFK